MADKKTKKNRKPRKPRARRTQKVTHRVEYIAKQPYQSSAFAYQPPQPRPDYAQLDIRTIPNTNALLAFDAYRAQNSTYSRINRDIGKVLDQSEELMRRLDVADRTSKFLDAFIKREPEEATKVKSIDLEDAEEAVVAEGSGSGKEKVTEKKKMSQVDARTAIIKWLKSDETRAKKYLNGDKIRNIPTLWADFGPAGPRPLSDAELLRTIIEIQNIQ